MMVTDRTEPGLEGGHIPLTLAPAPLGQAKRGPEGTLSAPPKRIRVSGPRARAYEAGDCMICCAAQASTVCLCGNPICQGCWSAAEMRCLECLEAGREAPKRRKANPEAPAAASGRVLAPLGPRARTKGDCTSCRAAPATHLCGCGSSVCQGCWSAVDGRCLWCLGDAESAAAAGEGAPAASSTAP